MSSKEKLLQLEEAGLHVFHGSPDGDIEVLEPRQGHHVPDLTKPAEALPDGEPAVAATPHSELATFRAIINRKNVPFSHNSSFGITDGEKTFRVSSQEVLDAAKGKKGYVYVFDKKDFKPYDRKGQPRPDSMEWRSHTSVKSLDVVEVTSDDLPNEERIKVGEEQ